MKHSFILTSNISDSYTILGTRSSKLEIRKLEIQNKNIKFCIRNQKLFWTNQDSFYSNEVLQDSYSWVKQIFRLIPDHDHGRWVIFIINPTGSMKDSPKPNRTFLPLILDPMFILNIIYK